MPALLRRAAAASLVVLASAASVLCTAGTAEARPFRVNEIPNGAASSCKTCHTTFGGIVFNDFGSDVRSHLVGDGAISARHVDWAALAARDSDGDGFTNGQELVDPDGLWRTGDPGPGGTPSAPGDPASVPATGACGDGVLAPSETCDGAELRDATCESQHLGVGTIVCGPDCRLDTSDCDRSTPDDDDGDDDGDAAPAESGSCAASPAGPGTSGGGLALALAAAALVVGTRRSRRHRD